MASCPAEKKMESTKDGGVLSPEKMLEKYKEKYAAAINIAQKAKNARDEAIKHNKMILTENESLREKIKQLENQYGTAEEMLAVLTDQKLKLAMELDDMKKQKALFIEELKTKEKALIEAENYKHQYNKLLKENEDLIKQLGSREQEYLQVRKEFEDLKKDNTTLKELYSSIQHEKEDLDNQFKQTLQQLCDFEENNAALNGALSQKFKTVVNDVREWIEIINCKEDSENNSTQTKEEISINSVTKEKENLELEIVDLNNRISNLHQELIIANNDRDQMMNNLEKVGLETKQLIENSEKLTDEIDVLKQEKLRQDNTITLLQNEKEVLSRIIKENEEEINQLCIELRECQKRNQELILKMESLETSSYFLSSNSVNEAKMSVDFFSKEMKSETIENDKNINLKSEETEPLKEKCIKKEKSVNCELNELQEELQAFSCEIGKYKAIADESTLKYEKAVIELSEKNDIICKQEVSLEELKMKVMTYEELEKALNTNLSECKNQLLSALKDISSAEEIKNSLKEESDLKDHKLATVMDDLEGKNSIIAEKNKHLENLETEIVTKNSILEDSNSRLNECKQEVILKDNEIKSLMAHTNELKQSVEKMKEESQSKLQTYQNEIFALKKIHDELQQLNESLSTDNANLNKQINDLLIEQKKDKQLVEKLTCLEEALQSQLKEEHTKINSLDQDALKSAISNLIEQNKNISEDNSDLKTQIANLLSKHSEECAVLAKENAELREQLNLLLMQATERDTNISNLKSDLNDIIKVRDYLEKGRELLCQEKSHLNDLIQNTTSCLFEINCNIESDIHKLNDSYRPSDKIFSKSDLNLDSSEMNMITKYAEELKKSQHILHEEIINLLNVNDCLLKENKSIKDKLDGLQSESSKLSSQLAELQMTKIAFEEHTNTIKELEEEKILLVKQADDLSSSNKLLQEKLNDAETQCNKLKSCRNDLEVALEKLQKEREIELFEHTNVVKLMKESLNEVEKKLTDQNLTRENLSKQYSLLDRENLNLKKCITELENKIKIMENQLQSSESSYSQKEKAYKEELDKLRADYEDKLKSVNEKFLEVSSLNENLNRELSSFKNKLEKLQSKYAEERSSYSDKNLKLQEELNNCNELLTFKTLELKENNRIWAGRFSSLKIALIGLNKGRKEIKNHFECLENLFASFMEQIKEPLQDKVNSAVQHSVSAAKLELINEMHQMNQALKERGETISKMEFAISEYQGKLKQMTGLNENLNAELVQNKSDLKNLEECLKEKDILIKQLENENEQLKENHYNATDTDVLSTSTISKAEEHSRLRDVEDSFEDRYSKLKLIAVKMKKRIGELTQSLETERSKMAAERTELQEKISSMSMAVKNAQKLQELIDQSLDERDELRNRNKVLENSLEELKVSEENLRDKITALEASNQSIPVMKKHIDSLNATIKDAKDEIHKLQMEIKAETIKYEELKKNNTKLEAKIQELTRLLEQAKQQGKSNNVLELEMKNYEKIVTDLSSQLNIEKNMVKSLQNENEAISNVKVGLEEQIAILEKQIKVEEERNHNTKEQLDLCRSKLDESNAFVESLNNEIDDLQKQLTHERNKNEALTLEMSQVTSEFSKKEISMVSKIGTLQEQIRSLETSLQSTKQELTTSKREIDHLNEEYEGYKLRAQTILAKRKGDFVTHGEKEAKDEVERLKKDCKILEEKLEAYISEIETLNTRISSLTLEKARSDKKIEEMRLALQQKITDYDLLNTEYYNFKISNETIIGNLKDELSKKKHEYQSELAHQKKIIDELTLEFKQKEDVIQTQNRDKTESCGFQDCGPLPPEREDGEGSESVPSPKTRRHSSIVPLDILLNSPIVDENKVIVLQEQVEKLRRELSSYEVRCRHLSSLLSETEKDSARNLHQNKILKEELRRLERSLERQPHIANTEYLKNIVFKFVTLPNGDERCRLVPVLDTLLKLSPEEMHKLNSVARGEAQAGWSSYLQSWTGL